VRRTALLIAAALLLPACGGDDDPKPSASPTAAVPMPTGTPTPVAPVGPKPTTLVTKDLVAGTGRTALPGKTVSVRYVGAHYDGKQFDSNFEPGESGLSFILGDGEVIPGWDEGLIGMREGGRRQLVIPPDLAYGARGGGQDSPIGPNETLVFVVDLISVDEGIGGANTFGP
jgi:peptidylprolyl isomerase